MPAAILLGRKRNAVVQATSSAGGKPCFVWLAGSYIGGAADVINPAPKYVCGNWPCDWPPASAVGGAHEGGLRRKVFRPPALGSGHKASHRTSATTPAATSFERAKKSPLPPVYEWDREAHRFIPRGESHFQYGCVARPQGRRPQCQIR